MKMVLSDSSVDTIFQRFVRKVRESGSRRLEKHMHFQVRDTAVARRAMFLAPFSTDTVNLPSNGMGKFRHADTEVEPPLNQTRSVVMAHVPICLRDVSMSIGKFHGHFHMDICRNVKHIEIIECVTRCHRTTDALISAIGRMESLETANLSVRIHGDPANSRHSTHLLEALSECRFLRELRLHTDWLTLDARQLEDLVINTAASLKKLSITGHTLDLSRFVCKAYSILGDEINEGRMNVTNFDFKVIVGNRSQVYDEWRVFVSSMNVCVARNRLGQGVLSELWVPASTLFAEIWKTRAREADEPDEKGSTLSDPLPVIVEDLSSLELPRVLDDSLFPTLRPNAHTANMKDAAVFLICARQRLIFPHQIPNIVREPNLSTDG